jgi:adenylate cyclase
MRILIIEDSSASRLLMSRMLKSIIPNAQICFANNGQNALVSISSENDYDLIVLDLGLPDIGGLQIIKLCKDMNVSSPIVTISDESNQDALKKSIDLGAIDYLTKPLHKQQLIQFFKNYIDIRSGEEAKKVLVVDDEDSNRMLLKMRVEKRGYEVHEATNGFQALRMMQKNYYSCVLMDIRMPFMDGIEATIILRRDYKHLPIIFITAEPLEAVAENCYKAGGNLVLAKPFNKEELLSSIDEMIQSSIEKMESVFDKEISLTDNQNGKDSYKTMLLDNFLKFVPDSVISQNNLFNQMSLGLDREEVNSVLIIDIREFKNITNKMSSTQKFNFLNSYFEMVGSTINNFGGTVYQFVGNHMVCIFPLYKGEYSNNAVHAATSIQDQIIIYNRGRNRAGYEPIEINCGLSTGTLSFGVCGTSNRHEVAIFGSAIDVATQSQIKCKDYNIDIAITEDVYKCLNNKDSFLVRPIGFHELEGVEGETALYEVFSHNSPLIRQGKKDCLEYLKEIGEIGPSLPIDQLVDKFPTDPVLVKLKSNRFKS